jgi:CheY-like chemotaxis protein
MSAFKYNNVMLIDDNELDNFINKKLVESEHFGNHVTVYQSALNALDDLKSMSPETLPDVIFLDIMMPQMDGFGFLEQFEKLDGKIRSKCKIIMLSTSESFKDLNKANQNKHVYKFLNKPLNKSVLEAINL